MNPFNYGVIVRGSNFYDRKEECRRIIETLSGGNNMVLYAPRRFGKTSLVFKVIEEMEKDGFICIYFDFMPVFSLESFFRLYSRVLASKYTNLQKFAKMFTSLITNIRPVLGFGNDGKPELSIDFAGQEIDETAISQLLDMPEKIAGTDKRVLVFFDEFQEVEKLQKVNFEALLRSKIQQQEKTNYLFFGSRTHLLTEMFNNKKKAFYNAASQMTIDGLPEEETIEYLQKKFAESGITIREKEVLHIISVTSNIPHYIQLLAAEVWQYMINSRKTVTRKIIDECANRLIGLKSDYYMELFDRQSNSKKELLQALTRNGENIFSSDYIRKNNLPGQATLQRAVSGLISDGIVEKNNRKYFIADPFFRRFVRERT